jgi:hypothetical protein
MLADGSDFEFNDDDDLDEGWTEEDYDDFVSAYDDDDEDSPFDVDHDFGDEDDDA